jgi:hypothetical protein
MRRSLFIVPFLLLLTGCFEIEQTINLQKDLSGTADFHLGIDMEPMVVVMAQFGREMEGKKGPVPAAELAKAKADFKKSMVTKKSTEPPPSIDDMSKDLPKGVKVLDFKATEKDFGVATDIKFGFDKLAHLVGVKLPQKSKKESSDPTDKNIIDSPFEGLQVVEKGDLITISTKPTNPAEKVNEEAADAPKMDPATEKMIKDAFSKMRVVYRLNAPFTIVSHNATRKEGNTLIWEYDLKKFEEMAKSKKLDDMQVKVVYKR